MVNDMNKNKLIKFKIELTNKSQSIEEIGYIYDQITTFIHNISNIVNDIDINTKIMNDDDPFNPLKYNTKNDTTEENKIIPENSVLTKLNEEETNKFNKIKEKFFDESNFNKHIHSLPKYYNKYQSRAIRYISDYLVKNRSAKLVDIVNGCKEQGYVSKAEDPDSAFYYRLEKLIASGKVTKEDKVYFWNYKEEEEEDNKETAPISTGSDDED